MARKRERLRDTIERAALAARYDKISSRLISRVIAAKRADRVAHQNPNSEEVERRYLDGVLARAGSLQQAASFLGIHLSMLWRKRRHYNLTRDFRKRSE